MPNQPCVAQQNDNHAAVGPALKRYEEIRACYISARGMGGDCCVGTVFGPATAAALADPVRDPHDPGRTWKA